MEETDNTWTLIASLSKNERIDVYEMFLNQYYGGENAKDGEQKYFTLPFSGALTVLDTRAVRNLCSTVVDIADLMRCMDELASATTTQTNGKKKRGGAAASSKSMLLTGDEDDYETGGILGPADVAGGGKKGGRRGGGKRSHKPAKNTAEGIRETRLIEATVASLPKLFESELDGRFSSNVVEVILLYYFFHINKNHQAKNIRGFLNALLSFRNAFLFFENRLYFPFDTIFRRVISFYQEGGRIPWRSFLQNHSELLIRCHFGQYYRSSVKPFPEQADLIERMREDPLRLFVLPWGVGCGKTALVAPISTIMWRDFSMHTIYCVPHGPVRDQTASNLYRCGIPFAYISGSREKGFDLLPSYHCTAQQQQQQHVNQQRNKSATAVIAGLPTAFIADSAFVAYFIEYWKAYLELVENDEDSLNPVENPPNIRLPNNKKRYSHITHGLWRHRFALVLDEPSEADPNLEYILENLPQASFIMSATSCDIITDQVKESYQRAHGANEAEVVPGRTIGVSTTLIGAWLESLPVLSSFSGIATRTAFGEEIVRVKNSVLRRRFLSPLVLLDWNDRIRTKEPTLGLDIGFDFSTLSFDHISSRILEWAEVIHTNILDDAWYAKTLMLPEPPSKKEQEQDQDQVPGREATLLRIFCGDAFRYGGGCVISVPHVKSMYNEIAGLLEGFPAFDEVLEATKRHKEETLLRVTTVMNSKAGSGGGGGGGAGGGSSGKRGGGGDKIAAMQVKEDKLLEIAATVWKEIPVPQHQIINTFEHLTRMGAPTSTGKIRFCSPLPLLQHGDLIEDHTTWDLSIDTIEGVDEDIQRFRWMGVGAIIDNKNFYMASIHESGTFLSFLLIDSLGSFGLNLKISHAILMEGRDGTILSREVLHQVAGRVGRLGQESSGRVNITSPRIFKRMMEA